MTKRGFIQVRVSEGDKAAIEAAAGAAGLGVSEWLRRVCLRAAGEGLPLQSSAEFRGSVEAMSEAQLAASKVVREAVEKRERVVAEKVLERFVVPASCPAPNTKKSFKPDFK